MIEFTFPVDAGNDAIRSRKVEKLPVAGPPHHVLPRTLFETLRSVPAMPSRGQLSESGDTACVVEMKEAAKLRRPPNPSE